MDDRVLHGSFGFAYLEAWSPFREQSPGSRDAISSYLRFAFAVVEREFGLGEHRYVDLTSDDHALGVVALGLAAELFRAALSVTLPGAGRGRSSPRPREWPSRSRRRRGG